MACGLSSGVGCYDATLASSYVQATAAMAGTTAEIATESKNAKYSALLNTHVFVPLAMETLGPTSLARTFCETQVARWPRQQETTERPVSCYNASLSPYNVFIRLHSVALCQNQI